MFHFTGLLTSSISCGSLILSVTAAYFTSTNNTLSKKVNGMPQRKTFLSA